MTTTLSARRGRPASVDQQAFIQRLLIEAGYLSPAGVWKGGLQYIPHGPGSLQTATPFATWVAQLTRDQASAVIDGLKR